jgi:hypothetical protein
MVMEYVEHDLKYILELQKAKKVCRRGCGGDRALRRGCGERALSKAYSSLREATCALPRGGLLWGALPESCVSCRALLIILDG